MSPKFWGGDCPLKYHKGVRFLHFTRLSAHISLHGKLERYIYNSFRDGKAVCVRNLMKTWMPNIFGNTELVQKLGAIGTFNVTLHGGPKLWSQLWGEQGWLLGKAPNTKSG